MPMAKRILFLRDFDRTGLDFFRFFEVTLRSSVHYERTYVRTTTTSKFHDLSSNNQKVFSISFYELLSFYFILFVLKHK